MSFSEYGTKVGQGMVTYFTPQSQGQTARMQIVRCENGSYLAFTNDKLQPTALEFPGVVTAPLDPMLVTFCEKRLSEMGTSLWSAFGEGGTFVLEVFKGQTYWSKVCASPVELRRTNENQWELWRLSK